MNRHVFKQAILVLAAMLVLLLVFQQTAEACPTCKNGLAEGEENVAQGYFWSILFMMSMPFLILSGLGLYFFLAIRRAKARQPQAAPQASTHAASSSHFELDSVDERADELVEV